MPFIGRDGRTAFLPTTVNTSSSLTIANEGDLIVDTNTLFVDSSTNKVGIRTTSPTSVFDVEVGAGAGINFDSSGDTAPTLNFMAGASRVESAAQILVGENNGGGDFIIGTKSANGTLTTRVTIDNSGLVKIPDNGKFITGAGNDLQIYHNGTHSYIDNVTGSLYIRGANGNHVRIQSPAGEESIVAAANGSVELYYDNSLKFETTNTGVTVTGSIIADGLSLGDGEIANFGTGNALQIYHSGSNGIIENTTGSLYIRDNANNVFIQGRSGENSGVFRADGAAELYHDNSKKIETTSTGVTVTGNVVANTFSGSLAASALTNITIGGTALPSVTNLLGGSLSGSLNAVTMAYLATAPSSPVQGQFYFNSLSSTAQIYTGSAFVDLVPSGGGGGGGGGSSSDANATFRKYTFAVSSTTNSISGASQGETSAGSFVTGLKYTIKTPGNTDFTAIGAANNTAGTTFNATGAGSGTGVAYNALIYSTSGDQNVEVYVNGVKAVEGATNDYVATSGTSVNFVANLASGDVVDVQVYELLTNDAYVLATGGTFTGNVGINTTSINNRLHIHSNANDQGILLTQAGSNYNAIIADANRTAVDNYILNLQANWNGNGVARIAMETGDDLTNKDDGRIKFFTSSSGSTPQVRMHIAPGGNVGIGLPENTNASSKLEVKGYNTISGSANTYLYSGNVGLKISGAEAALDLVSSDDGDHAGSILMRSVVNGFAIINNPTADSLEFKSFTPSGDDFYVHSTGAQTSALTTVMTLKKGGDVGIGDNSPSDRLTVYKSNAGNPTGITIRNTEASSTYSHARLRLESQNAAAYADIWADVANSALRLGYNSSSTVNINSSGRITSPERIYAGESYNISNVSGSIAGSGGGQDYIGLRHGTTFGLMLKTAGTNVGNIGIGETEPVDRLVVQETNASGDVAVRIKNDTLTDGSASTPTTASLYLNTSTGNFNTFYIQARRFDNATHFGYADPRATGHSPNLVITSAGSVGINRTDPDHKLSVNGNAEFNGYDQANAGGGYYTGGGLIIGNLYDAGKSYTGSDDRNACIWQERGLDLDVATSNALRVKITYDGKLKIGPIADYSINTTDCPVYIDVHSDISSFNTAEGAANTGLIRMEETGSNANRYHGFELRNRQSGDIRIMNLDVNTSDRGDLVIAMPDGEANAGLHFKARFNSLKSSIQISGKGGATLANSATEHVDVYIATKTGVTSINTGAGAELAGVIRFEDKGANNNRYHGLELRNRNSGDVRIFNQDIGVSNAGDLVFGVDNGSSVIEALRLHHNGQISQGTDSPPPDAEFTIRGANPELSLYATANYSSFLMMGDTNDYADGYIEYDNYSVSKGFKFITNNNHRMSLDSNGTLTVGPSSYSFGTVGARISQVSDSHFCRSGGDVIAIRRNTNDGSLVDFYQDSNAEGSIVVSGSTVSLVGGHLSRWTQLPGGTERTEILRGSVLTNLDEMCEWSTEAQEAVLYTEEDELPRGVNIGDVKTPAREANTEDNEQLNRMKVSDIEGDPNVAGVFQDWDDDDDTYTNDYYCAMTGDFVIRIAQGVTVARGDLLMSAGDGTAKPQDDDIVRSKTIAKVTSTHVSLTHPDGSYCVPCVLMAC